MKKNLNPEQAVANEIRNRKQATCSSSKSQKPYKLMGQNHGELLPLSGPTFPIDPKNQFYVVPNITYESMMQPSFMLQQNRPDQSKNDSGFTRNSLL